MTLITSGGNVVALGGARFVDVFGEVESLKKSVPAGTGLAEYSDGASGGFGGALPAACPSFA